MPMPNGFSRIRVDILLPTLLEGLLSTKQDCSNCAQIGPLCSNIVKQELGQVQVCYLNRAHLECAKD